LSVHYANARPTRLTILPGQLHLGIEIPIVESVWVHLPLAVPVRGGLVVEVLSCVDLPIVLFVLRVGVGSDIGEATGRGARCVAGVDAVLVYCVVPRREVLIVVPKSGEG